MGDKGLEIRVILDEIKQCIGELHIVIGELGKRLEPILSEEPEDKAGIASNAPIAYGSKLAQELEAQRQKIKVKVRQIQELTTRLQI